MKALALMGIATLLAGGWWLWRRAGVDVALGAVIAWCG